MKKHTLFLTSALAAVPTAALAQCSPASAPPGSTGCQPTSANLLTSDYLLGWQPENFPASSVKVPITQLAALIGGGLVSSVSLAMPPIFTVTGSPVTTSGTLTATLATEAANTVFAGPTTGVAAAPTFRGIVAADLGSVVVPVPNGGTGLSSGTSGGIPYFSAATTMASSGALAQYQLMVGGGAGAAPTAPVLPGNASQVLVSNGPSANPSFQNVPGQVIGNNTVLGNVSGTAQAASALSATQLNSIIGTVGLPVVDGGTGLSSGTSGGVLYFSAANTLASSGTLAQYQLMVGGGAGASPTAPVVPGNSGQVLTSNGAAANPSFQNVAGPVIGNNTVVGNVSGTTQAGSAISTAQLTTLCNQFSSSLSGCVPASGGGSVNFLRADGTWTTPASGNLPSGGSSGQVVINNGTSGQGAWSTDIVDLPGSITITGATGGTTAAGGTISITGGAGGSGIAHGGGDIVITGGAAGTSSAVAGNITITPGAGATGLNAGSITLQGATGVGSGITGGRIILQSGSPSAGNANGGDITINTAGAVGTATGGSVSVNTGGGYSGGSINFVANNGTGGVGQGGSINFTAGNNGSATAGKIVLNLGTGSTTNNNGQIQINGLPTAYPGNAQNVWNDNGVLVMGSTPSVPLVATTGTIGGGSLSAGACTSGTVNVSNAATTMAVAASPATYPGDGAFWHGYVSSAGTVTLKVCEAVAATPTASVYNVRVLQ